MNEDTLQIAGFKASAVKGGIRGKDRLDIGLIYSEEPAVAAGVFTTSRVKAAPVLLDMERLQDGKAQAVLVNSGIANACSGKQGMAFAKETAKLVADALQIPEVDVLVSSTGVIGQQLDVANFADNMDSLVKGLKPDGFKDVAQAIMTTDTVPKTAVRKVSLGGQEVKLFGLAKGAGMIMPNMATMLCFIMTDANITHDALQSMLSKGVEKSFNAITVDGDTSTNDTVLVLASGKAGNVIIAEEDSVFQNTLDDLLKDLALQIVADGEGATKLVTVRVKGARSDEDADLAARTIANSPLVKTAFFGEDANWGRIIGALGRSGADFDQDKVDIAFDDVFMVVDGLGQGAEVEAEATKVLKQKEFAVTVDLKYGKGYREIYTCDFSIDYVKINADYRS
jgi:glutamate N-acetyltransferase/amino-acid N-acetyltransferase